MVKRRPDTVIFDWKEVGSYSETTGRRVEGGTVVTKTIPARIEPSKKDFIEVGEKKVSVSVNIYADLRDLQGTTIPSNAYITYRGERKEVVKIETLQTHIVIWV